MVSIVLYVDTTGMNKKIKQSCNLFYMQTKPNRLYAVLIVLFQFEIFVVCLHLIFLLLMTVVHRLLLRNLLSAKLNVLL